MIKVQTFSVKSVPEKTPKATVSIFTRNKKNASLKKKTKPTFNDKYHVDEAALSAVDRAPMFLKL